MKKKSLNTSYNICYNNNGEFVQIEKALQRSKRRNAVVHFHPHCEIRAAARNIDVDKIVETVRTGKLLRRKSRPPKKIAFKRFFKEGHSYVVVAVAYPNSFQVRTVWKKKGKI